MSTFSLQKANRSFLCQIACLFFQQRRALLGHASAALMIAAAISASACAPKAQDSSCPGCAPYRHAVAPAESSTNKPKPAAEREAESREWTGFKAASEKEVPPTVARVALSVYQIIYPQGTATIVDLEKPLPEMKNTDLQWAEVQVQVCRRQELKACPVFHSMGGASAWVSTSPGTLSTNLHALHPWVHQALKHNPATQITALQLPVLLRDANGTFISNLRAPLRARVTRFSGGEKLWQEPQTSSRDFMMGEHVEITFEKTLFEPALKRAVSIAPDEVVYLIGYPNKTDVFKKFSGTDSPGDKLRVSSGKLVRSETEVQDTAAPDLYYSNAGHFGNSGGPVVNSRGEVVGIVFGGFSRDENGELKTSIATLNLTAQKRNR